MDSQQIGVYVHWPFCTRLCPYCDFNIYKNKPEMAADLTAAILADLETWRAQSGVRKLVSIHFGGGTPSLMPPEHMSAVIKKARTLWTPQTGLEIALEANPGDISPERLEQWKTVGIERLSIGVQSFDDRVLRFLGRNHDGATARNALEQSIQIMPRVSADMIYGWAGQTAAHWRAELEELFRYGPGHISTYQLTIEEKTAFAKAEERGERRAVDTDQSADLFELTGHLLGAAGYERYEVSNFAQTPSDQSRHNKLYWQGSDYAGVGPGAHGRLTHGEQRTATITALTPGAYIKAAGFHSPATTREKMSREARAEEYVLMGLRISEGISLAEYNRIAGQDLPADIIKTLVLDGLLVREQDRLCVSGSGRLVLDAISHALLASS